MTARMSRYRRRQEEVSGMVINHASRLGENLGNGDKTL